MKIYFAIIVLFIYSFNKTKAQSSWKLPISFEDANNAKDTIWCIWDTTATFSSSPGPYDTLLNEGPAITNHSIFNVWIYNYNGDSTKTLAQPFSTPIGFSLQVRAFNYQYPITVSWDTSLFYSPYIHQPVGYINYARIDNDYFFLANNDPPIQMYNMLLDDHALAPPFGWGSQSHFPMSFYIWGDPNINLNEISYGKQVTIQPNPFLNKFFISSSNLVKQLEVSDISGKIMLIKKFESPELLDDFEITFLSNHFGIFILTLLTDKNQLYHEKIIKIP